MACWMSEKKLIKFNWPEFEKLCGDNGIETFQVCLFMAGLEFLFV